MKPYRRWGEISEIKDALIDPKLASTGKSVVAVTLARLKLNETLRFIKWGKPVEKQARDHPGKTIALAAMRPFHTFCTFSIWKSEAEMLDMVNGRGDRHHQAMQERNRRDFHYEFTTLRFSPFKNAGSWDDKSNFTHLESDTSRSEH